MVLPWRSESRGGNKGSIVGKTVECGYGYLGLVVPTNDVEVRTKSYGIDRNKKK